LTPASAAAALAVVVVVTMTTVGQASFHAPAAAVAAVTGIEPFERMPASVYIARPT